MSASETKNPTKHDVEGSNEVYIKHDTAAADCKDSGGSPPAPHRCGGRILDRLLLSHLRGARQFLLDIRRDYGWRFPALVSAVYFCMKGFAYICVSAGSLPYYKNVLKVGASDYQRFYNVSDLAWSFKPLIGIVSDNFRLFGYHKRYYIVIMCAVAAAAMVLCPLVVQRQSSEIAGPASSAMFFVTFLCVAGVDVLVEGKYSELLNRIKATPAIVTLVWLCYSIGLLIGASIEGPLADAGRVDVVFLLAAPFLGLPAVCALMGWVPERKGGILAIKAASITVSETSSTPPSTANNAYASSSSSPGASSVAGKVVGGLSSLMGTPQASAVSAEEEPLVGSGADGEETSGPRAANPYHAEEHDSQGSDRDRIHPFGLAGIAEEQEEEAAMVRGPVPLDSAKEDAVRRQRRGLTVLGILAAAVSLTAALLSLFTSPQTLLMVIIPASAAMLAFTFYVMPRTAAKANLFIILSQVCYLQISAYLDYFYTADATCLPDGPHFEFFYYQTLSSVLGSIGSILGTMIFQRFLSNMTYQKVYYFTTTLKIAASLFDLIMVRRWNHRAGINDKATFLLGDAIIVPICTMLDFMPSTVLLSRLCPKGLESTMFALLAGFSNYGRVISSAMGIVVAQALGGVGDHGSCDFSNLYLLILIGHLAMPAVGYALIYVLMPARKMTEPLFEEEEVEEEEKKANEERQAEDLEEGNGNGQPQQKEVGSAACRTGAHPPHHQAGPGPIPTDALAALVTSATRGSGVRRSAAEEWRADDDQASGTRHSYRMRDAADV